ncbi:MAG TPA: 3-isopropylmalate dehydrogenase, partial [Longimicrobiales bacterium]|nr:3-isopropylmalate dehydrogenase [Longimicrobiales bacterium]
MSDLHVVVLPGDGIGQEVSAAMLRVLEAVGSRFGHRLTVDRHDVGYTAWEKSGTPLPEATLEACRKGPAVFLGAVGDPRADALPPGERPEAALLKLRSELGCYANLRPARVDDALVERSALRREVAAGCDLVIVRELTGGLYYGQPRGRENGRAINTLVYSEAEVERVARVAFELARKRHKKVTSVDKANVLEVSQLWRSVVERVAASYPDVELDHMYVDRAAMELVTAPKRFDVVLTENLFGDILSDEASAMCGSLGLLASASVGGAVGLYEPVHGS